MKTISIHLAAMTIVLLVCSTASAGWTYAAPGYTTYWSAAPGYAYPAPVTFVQPAPLIYPAPVVIRPAPVVVHSTVVKVRGRAVRRAIRRGW